MVKTIVTYAIRALVLAIILMLAIKSINLAGQSSPRTATDFHLKHQETPVLASTTSWMTWLNEEVGVVIDENEQQLPELPESEIQTLDESQIEKYESQTMEKHVSQTETTTTSYTSTLELNENSDFRTWDLEQRLKLSQNRRKNLIFKMGINKAEYIVAKDHYFDNKIPGSRVSPVLMIRKILILTNGRSGSSFLGQAISSYPGTFYTYEPLKSMEYQDIYFPVGDQKNKVLSLLRRISTCSLRLEDQELFLEYFRKNVQFIPKNERYWRSCHSIDETLCYNSTFFNEVCSLMPVNVIKTIRLGAESLPDLLEAVPDLRVVHLFRDPRGSIASRKRIPGWCEGYDCVFEDTICNNMLRDLKMSPMLREQYPDRYIMTRYEDIATAPKAMIQGILNFVGLDNTVASVDEFLDDHTEYDGVTGNPYSTKRNSAETVFAWRDKSSYAEVQEVQSVCRKTIDLLGFRVFESEQEYENKSLSIDLNYSYK